MFKVKYIHVFRPSAERKKNNNRYFDKKVQIRRPVKCTIQGAQNIDSGLSKMLYWWKFHQYSEFMKCVEQNGAFRKDNKGVTGHHKYCIIEPTAGVTVVGS